MKILPCAVHLMKNSNWYWIYGYCSSSDEQHKAVHEVVEVVLRSMQQDAGAEGDWFDNWGYEVMMHLHGTWLLILNFEWQCSC